MGYGGRVHRLRAQAGTRVPARCATAQTGPSAQAQHERWRWISVADASFLDRDHPPRLRSAGVRQPSAAAYGMMTSYRTMGRYGGAYGMGPGGMWGDGAFASLELSPDQRKKIDGVLTKEPREQLAHHGSPR